MDAAPKAAAAQEEEELAPVRLSEPEDNFAVGIVDLALLAVQNDAPDLDRTVWDMVTSNVKTAVKVIHNVERGAESLAEFFAMEDRLETKSNTHAGERWLCRRLWRCLWLCCWRGLRLCARRAHCRLSCS